MAPQNRWKTQGSVFWFYSSCCTAYEWYMRKIVPFFSVRKWDSESIYKTKRKDDEWALELLCFCGCLYQEKWGEPLTHPPTHQPSPNAAFIFDSTVHSIMSTHTHTHIHSSPLSNCWSIEESDDWPRWRKHVRVLSSLDCAVRLILLPYLCLDVPSCVRVDVEIGDGIDDASDPIERVRTKRGRVRVLWP